MFLVKLPNILAFQPVPFDPEQIEEILIDEQAWRCTFTFTLMLR